MPYTYIYIYKKGYRPGAADPPPWGSLFLAPFRPLRPLQMPSGKPEGNMWRTTEGFGVPRKRHLPPLNATILSF